MSSTPEHSTPTNSTQPTLFDWMFILACVLALCVVAFLGKLAYVEAMKTETAKRNGEAVMTWMQEASTGRFEADYAVAACAGSAPKPAGAIPASDNVVSPPNTWGGCICYVDTNIHENTGQPFPRWQRVGLCAGLQHR